MASSQVNKYNMMHSDKRGGPGPVSCESERQTEDIATHAIKKSPVSRRWKKNTRTKKWYLLQTTQKVKCKSIHQSKILKSRWLLIVIIAYMCVYTPLSFIIHFHMHHLVEASLLLYRAGKARSRVHILERRIWGAVSLSLKSHMSNVNARVQTKSSSSIYLFLKCWQSKHWILTTRPPRELQNSQLYAMCISS